MSMSKIALAIPIVIGIGSGCSTMGQYGVDTTGAMWTDGSMSERVPRDAATQAYMQGTGSQGKDQGSPGGAVSPDGGPGSPGSMGSTGSSQSSDSAGSSGSSGAMGSSDSQGSSGSTGSSDSPGASGSMGSQDQSPSGAQGSGGAMGSTDQGTSGAGDVKGHADDQTVRGKLSKVSKEEISITPQGGDAKTLKISPQTVVTINGRDAKPTQLKQGQQVRASYQDQDGEDVAVKIEVGKAAARKGKTSGQMKGRGGSDHAGHGHGGSMGGGTR